MNYRVLIVDDEKLAREAIAIRLQAFHEFEICDEADNGKDGVLLAESLKPDIVFLDIEMPEFNGIEAAKLISENNTCLIVFVSAYHHYALEAFRVNAIDYLLKPINDTHFSEMIEKLSLRLKEKNSIADNRQLKTVLQRFDSDEQNPSPKYLQRLALKDGDETLFINVEEIESIVSVKDYLCIKTNGKTFVHRCTMKQMEQMLNPDVFIRCHRSHIVNNRFIRKQTTKDGATQLVTESKDEHPVSRRYRARISEFLSSI